MTTSLYWQPAQRPAGNHLPDALKFILRKRFRGDGPCVRRTMGSADLDYLRGLADADVDGAQDLIDAIDQHGDVELEEQ
jgi:hypothetical protein